jgi:predicted DNA-binding protein
MAWKTYKIDLSPEQEEWMKKQKQTTGTPISWQLTEAVKNYINQKNKEQNAKV